MRQTDERLVVRNFGPITKLDINIYPFTIFVGTQGSGKSTISKLITICRDVRWWIQILENDNVMRPFVDFGIEEYFQKNSYILYTFKEDKVEYVNGKFSYESDETTEKKSLITLLKSIISGVNDSFLSRTGGLNKDSQDDKISYLMNANSRLGLYVLAERNIVGQLSNSLASIILNSIPLSKTILEYMSIFEKAKKEFPKYNVPFLGMQFVIVNGQERIQLKGRKKNLSLSSCSSGLQSVLPMLMVIDYALKTQCFDAFVIEEPEQNLFPENQRELLYFLMSKYKTSLLRQLIVTTHSPYFLSCLNVLMLAHILYQNDDDLIRDKVAEIVRPEYMIDPQKVAVYSLKLSSENKNYCTNIVSEQTNLVSANEIDSVSDYIGDDFDRLYELFLETKKNKK